MEDLVLCISGISLCCPRIVSMFIDMKHWVVNTKDSVNMRNQPTYLDCCFTNRD